ncbi:MAG: hypothetical protein JSR33_00100 [Proteobacteria bacterium]|nr:hypothetical protein [Pseudomonadota bacterium]
MTKFDDEIDTERTATVAPSTTLIPYAGSRFALSVESDQKLSPQDICQQATELFYNDQYIAAFRNLSSVLESKNEDAEYVAQAYIIAIKVFCILRMIDPAMILINKLEEKPGAESVKADLVTIKLLLLAYRSAFSDQGKERKQIKKILNEKKAVVASSYLKLLKLFQNSSKLSFAKEFKNSNLPAIWLKAAAKDKMTCYELNYLYFWSGLLLSAHQDYSQSEVIFNKIFPIHIVKKFDTYQIEPDKSVKMSYLCCLQILLNKREQGKFDEFLNHSAISEIKTQYADCYEVELVLGDSLVRNMVQVNETTISQYAALITPAIDILKQYYSKDRMIEIFKLIANQLKQLFSFFYSQRYYYAFEEIPELQADIASGKADYAVFFANMDEAADLYALATSQEHDVVLEVKAHQKRYMLSYIKEIKQLNRQSIRNVIALKRESKLLTTEAETYCQLIDSVGTELKGDSGFQSTELERALSKFKTGDAKAFYLKSLVVILFHRQLFRAALECSSKLTDQFPAFEPVETALYKARIHAALRQPEFREILHKLTLEKRQKLKLKNHDILLIAQECEIQYAIASEDLIGVIQLFKNLSGLRTELMRDYQQSHVPLMDKLNEVAKGYIVSRFSADIIDEMTQKLEVKPQRKKTPHSDQWHDLLAEQLTGFFVEVIQFQDCIFKIPDTIQNLYEADISLKKAQDTAKKVNLQLRKFFTEMKKPAPQTTTSVKIVTEPILSKRNIFMQCLEADLEEGFNKAWSYQHGFKPDTPKIGDKIQLLTMAATLLPLGSDISKGLSGISLFLRVANDMYEVVTTGHGRTLAARILKLLPEGYRNRDISDFCDQTAELVAEVYADQIEKLSVQPSGIPLFAKQAAVIMLWYIATDQGQRPGFFNVTTELRSYCADLLRSITHPGFLKKEELRNNASTMASGLFFTPLTTKRDQCVRVMTEDKELDKTNPWTVEGILRRSAIEQGGKIYIAEGISQYRKYGKINIGSTVTPADLQKYGYRPVFKNEPDSAEEVKASSDDRCLVM